MRTVTIVTLLTAMLVALAGQATAGRDPLVGVWIAHDVQGDGSTDRYIFSMPKLDGVRGFTLAETYATFCETAGAGTGSALTAKGTATLSGTHAEAWVTSWVCENGLQGTFEAPVKIVDGDVTGDDLDVGYAVAHRAGT